MSGQSKDNDMVMCCFTGNWIERNDAIKLKISLLEDSTETQTLFVGKSIFNRLIVDKIPLHPDFLEVNES